MITQIQKVLNERELVCLATAEESEIGRVLLKVIEIERDQLRHINENEPKRSPGNLKHDYVYLLGATAKLNEVLLLPKKAKEIINAIERGT